MLGFTYQSIYTAYRFLVEPANSSGVFGIEVFDDTSIENIESILNFQLKSTSSSSNPTADRSIELWKTMSNWTNSLKNGIYGDKQALFVYVVISSKEKTMGPLCSMFDKAFDEPSTENALARVREELKKCSDSSSPTIGLAEDQTKNKKKTVNDYMADCLSDDNIPFFKKVILSFKCEFVQAQTLSKESLVELVKAREAAFQSFSEGILFSFVGSLQIEITNQLEKFKCFSVPYSRLLEIFSGCVNQFDQNKTLKDYSSLPSEEEREQEKASNPVYVRQLEKIGFQEKDVYKRIDYYLRAAIQLSKMADNKDVPEAKMDEYQVCLKDTWSREKEKINILCFPLNEEEKGRLLLLNSESEVTSKKVTLNEIEPPYYFGGGVLQHLADKQTIWWHPDFEKKEVNK